MAYYRKLQDGGFNFSFVDPQANQQFLNAASARQQRFDQSNAMLNQQLTALGETETFDPTQLQGRVSGTQENINRIVKDKYGGDYGAAVNEITRQLAAERRNPFYGLNREKVRQGRILEQARAKNPDRLITTNDPFSVDITKTGVTPESLQAGFRLRTDDQKYVRENFSAAEKKAIDFIAAKSNVPGYTEKIAKQGLAALTPEDWNNILSDEDVNRYIEESSFMVDPNVPEELKTHEGAKARLKDKINSIYGSKIQSSFIKDPTVTSTGATATTTPLNFGVSRGIPNPYGFTEDDDMTSGTGLSYIKSRKRNSLISKHSAPLIAKYGLEEVGTPDEILALAKTPVTLSKGYIRDGLVNQTIESIKNGDIEVSDEIRKAIGSMNAEFSPNAKRTAKSRVSNLLIKNGIINTDSIDKAAEQGAKMIKFKEELEKNLNDEIGKDNTLNAQFRTSDLFTPYTKQNTATRARLKDLDTYASANLDLKEFDFLQSGNDDIDFKNQPELAKDRDEEYEYARRSGNLSIKGVETLPEVGLVLRVETRDKDGNLTEHIIKPNTDAVEGDLVKAFNNPELTQKYIQNRTFKVGADFLDNQLPQLIENGILDRNMTYAEMLDVLNESPQYQRLVPAIATAAQYFKFNETDRLYDN